MEHVIGSQGSWTRYVQELIDPIWKLLNDGCSVKGQPWNNMHVAGFSKVKYEHITIDFSKESFFVKISWLPVCRPHIMGFAEV